MTSRDDDAGSSSDVTGVRIEPAVSPGDDDLLTLTDAQRYAAREEIGAGGMGEVRLERDRRIGRDVARKVMRAELKDDADARARFLREARVQGQLQHPSIVPVYDLGASDGGDVWFTMKRVRGHTLTELLGASSDGAPHGSRRVLTAFTQLCLALDYAHERGVVHRDLKPDNVMLGDFGEVYVLDWGLAKMAGDPDDGAPLGGDRVSRVDDIVAELHTHAGAIIGTPGYMAPEQLLGDGRAVDRRADVYALGAILFHVLAREPLHGRGPTHAIVASTLGGPEEARPSVRARDREVAPELDGAVLRATALDPAARFPTARALGEEVERYLEGDRDAVMRRERARHHSQRARAALERALDTEAPGARREAAEEAARALALDPEEATAATTLVELFARPPRSTPEAVRERLRQSRARRMSRYFRLNWIAALGYLGVASAPLFFDIVEVPSYVGLVATLVAFALLCRWAERHSDGGSRLALIVPMLGVVALWFTSRVGSSLFAVPAFAIAGVYPLCVVTGVRYRALLGALGSAAVVVPIVAETIGLVSPTLVWRPTHLEVVGRLVDPGAPAWVFASLGVVLALAPLFMVLALASTLHQRELDLEAAMQLRSWQLEQALPERARKELHAAR